MINIKQLKNLSMVLVLTSHNYYMQILNETGVIGFVLIFLFITFVIIDSIKKIYFIKTDKYLTKSYLISILIFLIVLSSGSFLTIL